jgi:hypothetical protein
MVNIVLTLMLMGTFILTTIATVMSGFAFPADHLLPSHLVGMVALVLIGLAIAARSGLELAGASRRVHVVATMGALYLTVAAGVVRAFLKVSVLRGLAPQQTEAPCVVTQGAVLGWRCSSG